MRASAFRGAGYAALVAASAALAAVTPTRPGWVAAGVLALACAVFAARRGGLFWLDLITVLLAAALTLGYGFANVGIGGNVPLPLADLVLLVLLVRMLGTVPLRGNLWPFAALAAAFFVVASARLYIDYPTYGADAARDYTIAPELGFLFVGYWAVRRYGLRRWLGALRWAFGAALLYFALYPLHTQLASAGPVVGLHRPVPLLGDYSGGQAAAVAGFFFFALLRPLGRASYLVAACFLPPLAFFQSRGGYVAFAVSFLLVVVGTGGNRLLRARPRIVKAVAIGACLLTATFAVGFQGRLAPVTAGVVQSQLATLGGRAGVGQTNYQIRVHWFHLVLSEVRSHRLGWLVGVGLGPDLVNGFSSGDGVPVRKPHDDYLELYGRLGVLGLIPFVALLLGALVRIWRGALRFGRGVEAQFLWWTAAAAAAYIVVAATQPLLAYPFGTIPLFATLGAGLAVTAPARRVGLDRAGQNAP